MYDVYEGFNRVLNAPTFMSVKYVETLHIYCALFHRWGMLTVQSLK